MAPSRRLSNGRSPLVNQQRQITSFFSKHSSSPSPSPTPTVPKQIHNRNPNPKPEPSRNPSLSPTTPSPLHSKQKKPRLVIGPTLTPSPAIPSEAPHTAKQASYGDEVVGKRIRVYWPLDQSWYEGCVKSFDKASGKHLVQYDDSDEEVLDLRKEKIEWVQESAREFRRLRRPLVVDVAVAEEESVDEGSCGDGSSDEDWGKNADNEAGEEDVSEDTELEGVDDDEDSDSSIKIQSKKADSRKRKTSGEKLGSNKKIKSSPGAETREEKVLGGIGCRLVETATTTCGSK